VSTVQPREHIRMRMVRATSGTAHGGDAASNLTPIAKTPGSINCKKAIPMESRRYRRWEVFGTTSGGARKEGCGHINNLIGAGEPSLTQTLQQLSRGSVSASIANNSDLGGGQHAARSRTTIFAESVLFTSPKSSVVGYSDPVRTRASLGV